MRKEILRVIMEFLRTQWATWKGLKGILKIKGVKVQNFKKITIAIPTKPLPLPISL